MASQLLVYAQWFLAQFSRLSPRIQYGRIGATRLIFLRRGGYRYYGFSRSRPKRRRVSQAAEAQRNQISTDLEPRAGNEETNDPQVARPLGNRNLGNDPREERNLRQDRNLRENRNPGGDVLETRQRGPQRPKPPISKIEELPDGLPPLEIRTRREILEAMVQVRNPDVDRIRRRRAEAGVGMDQMFNIFENELEEIQAFFEGREEREILDSEQTYRILRKNDELLEKKFAERQEKAHFHANSEFVQRGQAQVQPYRHENERSSRNFPKSPFEDRANPVHVHDRPKTTDSHTIQLGTNPKRVQTFQNFIKKVPK